MSELCPEPLLLPALIDVHCGNAPGDGAILEIMRGLMTSPRTDAERAGERLVVFGWQVDGYDHVLRWVYRIVGEETGDEHARVRPGRAVGAQRPAVPAARSAAADHAERWENASSEELDAYLELAQAART